jgi:tetratricopeptide (TPR) repeat protein
LWKVLLQLRVKGAWLGAAIWTLHPVQVESVAWVTELKNTQSCFFYLLSILFFLKWRDDGATTQDRHSQVWKYATALFCGVLAILSKSSTVMLPVVLGLCWWWMDGRWRWRDVTKLVPFVSVSALAAGWTIWEQKFHNGAVGADWAQTWLERFIIAGRDVWFYLGKLLWPHPLIFIYPRWQIDASQALAYLPALAAGAGLILLWWKRNGPLRPVFFAATYFVVSLFPVLGFFNVYFFRYSFVGDHLQYLASIGPLVLIGSGIASAFDFFARQRPFLKPVSCGALLCLLGALSWRQAGIYCSLDTLWSDTVQKNPAAWMAQNGFASVLMQKGRVREALPHLERALKMKPDSFETQDNLGYAATLLGRIEESLPYFSRAVEIEPNRVEPHHNLGKTLLLLGRLEEADMHLRRALEIDPRYVPAHNDLGKLLLQSGHADESLVNLQQALQIDPNYRVAHYNIANTLFYLGRVDEAVSHLEKALAMEPSTPEGQKNVAWVLATSPEARIRDGAKAVQYAERANELSQGKNPLIVATLAAAYAEVGRFPDAIQTAEKASQLATDSGLALLAQAIRGHLEFYRSGQPFRDIQ